MKKIIKLFRAVALILKKPALLNKVLDDQDVNRAQVSKRYDLPQGLKTVDITKLFPGFSETVAPFSYLDGGSTPIDLALLRGMARKFSHCAYLEIGTWRGESVANVAAVAEKCVTVNLPDETMIAMGLDRAYIGLHRYFSKDLSNVTHIQADSRSFDFSSLEQKFDLIFIDGDHHYESVRNDTEKAFKLLRDANSVIVWHDYGNTPSDIRWDVLRGILDGAPDAARSNLYRVSNTLCAIYFPGKVESYYPKAFQNPSSKFEMTIKAVPL